MTAVVSDWRYIIENFLETLFQKPIIGILLYLNKVGHIKNFFSMRIAHADAFSGFNWSNSFAIH